MCIDVSDISKTWSSPALIHLLFQDLHHLLLAGTVLKENVMLYESICDCITHKDCMET